VAQTRFRKANSASPDDPLCRFIAATGGGWIYSSDGNGTDLALGSILDNIRANDLAFLNAPAHSLAIWSFAGDLGPGVVPERVMADFPLPRARSPAAGVPSPQQSLTKDDAVSQKTSRGNRS
jgi:hypothetical protein